MNERAAAAAMDALGTELRLAIYRQLVRVGRQGLSITEIQQRFGGIPRSTLAHHLHKLLQAGLITQQKDGASVISRANYDVMDALVDYLTGECCVGENRFEEGVA
ncbi:MAG: helix-turn-helix transcriptional regulator [Trueperaceae bacterium]|nr:MAG: helix-turn-helix transcriptional regulator [Trueperaceae bacterium]